VSNAFIPWDAGEATGVLKRSSITSGPSPTTRIKGASTTALRRLLYHARSTAELPTTGRQDLMTTARRAVVKLERTPKNTPMSEGGMAAVVEPFEARSRRTPTKKPAVTSAQAMRTLSEGRAWMRAAEVATVMGRTRPRATW
jgi:electron transfer flavoprotein alpha subunit